MKTITDSLKNFYAKLGGNPSNLPSRSTSADIIDAMSDVYTDKEGTHVEVTTQVTEGTKIATVKTNNEDHDIYAPTELPSVTSSDEGKVLTVDSNGDWGAATPSGGNSSFIVNISENSEGNITANHTYAEIITALNAGKVVGASWTSEMGYSERLYQNVHYIPLHIYYGEDVRFLVSTVGDGELHNMEIVVSSSNISINEVTLSAG